MNDGIDHINAETDRLALKTTDPEPMRLFVGREQLRKRMQTRKFGSHAAAILAGIAFFSFFASDDYGVIEASVVGIAAAFLVMIAGRRALNAQVQDWLGRARQVAGG